MVSRPSHAKTVVTVRLLLTTSGVGGNRYTHVCVCVLEDDVWFIIHGERVRGGVFGGQRELCRFETSAGNAFVFERAGSVVRGCGTSEKLYPTTLLLSPCRGASGTDRRRLSGVCVCVYCNNNTRRGRLPPAGQINVNSILRDRARPNSFAVPHLVVGEASRANNTAVRRAYRVTH